MGTGTPFATWEAHLPKGTTRMKARNLVSALIIGSVMSVGTAMAQTTPSNTPAPSHGSTQDHASPSKTHMKKKMTKHAKAKKTRMGKKHTMHKSSMSKDVMGHSTEGNMSAPSDSVPKSGSK
jgi:hypothetical protein